mgnify:CR=1 FL=1
MIEYNATDWFYNDIERLRRYCINVYSILLVGLTRKLKLRRLERMA